MSYAKYGASIPEFLRKFREEAGLTQQDLADAMKVSAGYVANVENGYYPNPVLFCWRLMEHIEEGRKKYLQSLIETSNENWLSNKLESNNELRKPKVIRRKATV